MRTIILAPALLLAGTAWCVDADQPAISPDVLPAPVKATVVHEIADAPITQVDHDMREGQEVYRIRYRLDGTDHSLAIANDGKLVARDEATPGKIRQGWEKTKEGTKHAWEATKEGAEDAWVKTQKSIDRDGLTIDNVPAAVRKTILQEAHGNEIKDIDVGAERGKVFYQAAIRVKEGKDYDLRVAEDGTLLSETH